MPYDLQVYDPKTARMSRVSWRVFRSVFLPRSRRGLLHPAGFVRRTRRHIARRLLRHFGGGFSR